MIQIYQIPNFSETDIFQIPNLPDTEMIRNKIYRIPNLSDTRFSRYWFSQIPNSLDTEQIWYRTYQILIFSNTELIRYRTDLIPNWSDIVLGTKIIRFRSYLLGGNSWALPKLCQWRCWVRHELDWRSGDNDVTPLSFDSAVSTA